MRHTITIILSIFLIGCSGEKRIFSVSDGEFSRFEVEFYEDAEFFGRSVDMVPINFYEISSFDTAQCVVYEPSEIIGIETESEEREIFINKSKWDNLSEFDKKAIIYHELGHCGLDRDHISDYVEFEGHRVKSSLMHHDPRGLLGKTINGELMHDRYIKELFLGGTL